jgi:hypothetical protein
VTDADSRRKGCLYRVFLLSLQGISAPPRIARHSGNLTSPFAVFDAEFVESSLHASLCPPFSNLFCAEVLVLANHGPHRPEARLSPGSWVNHHNELHQHFGVVRPSISLAMVTAYRNLGQCDCRNSMQLIWVVSLQLPAALSTAGVYLPSTPTKGISLTVARVQ